MLRDDFSKGLKQSCIVKINEYCKKLYFLFNTYEQQISLVNLRFNNSENSFNLSNYLNLFTEDQAIKFKELDKVFFLFDLFALSYNNAVNSFALAFDNINDNYDYIVLFLTLSSIYLPYFYKELKQLMNKINNCWFFTNYS